MGHQRFRTSDIHARMMRGESIPAWRPPEAAVDSGQLEFAAAESPAPVHIRMMARAVLRQITEAREDIDLHAVRAVCQWAAE